MHVNACNWLLENADVPIRYRVYREFLKDEKATLRLEADLLDNPNVKYWLGKLTPLFGEHFSRLFHGAQDYCLENSILKAVQLGLNIDILSFRTALKPYVEYVEKTPVLKPYRKSYIGHDNNYDLILPTNLLVYAGLKNKTVHKIMLENIYELHEFVKRGDCDIYLNSEERAKLKGIPKNWRGVEHFTRLELFEKYGLCWPLIYDIVGLTKIYGLYGGDIDTQIDDIINFISSDDFHDTITDMYGVVITTGKTKYKGCGWDPKYPGWFNIVDYMENPEKQIVYTLGGKSTGYPAKALFFAMIISHFPIARKTKWFIDLVNYLEKYKTYRNTYIFPKQWLIEKQGCAVLGNHLSFGENRRKKNWVEIESTFYVQLLQQYM